MGENLRDRFDALPDKLAKQVARHGLLDPYELHARPLTLAMLFDAYMCEALSDYEPTRERYGSVARLVCDHFGADRLADDLGWAEAGV